MAKVKERGNLSSAEIGEIVGVGTRQVQNWASGHGAPASTKRLRQLLDLEYVLDLVTEVFDEEGATMGLHARTASSTASGPWT